LRLPDLHDIPKGHENVPVIVQDPTGPLPVESGVSGVPVMKFHNHGAWQQ